MWIDVLLEERWVPLDEYLDRRRASGSGSSALP
jgi:hypothetical protein